MWEYNWDGAFPERMSKFWKRYWRKYLKRQDLKTAIENSEE